MILGDTCDSHAMIPIANDADVLVHESTNENSHEEKCRENGHSTPGFLSMYDVRMYVVTITFQGWQHHFATLLVLEN